MAADVRCGSGRLNRLSAATIAATRRARLVCFMASASFPSTGAIPSLITSHQDDNQVRAPAADPREELHLGAPQIRAGEHQRLVPPSLRSDDGDSLDVVAVLDEERQVAPVRARLPPLERGQDEQQADRADAPHLGRQLLLAALEIGFAERAAEVDAIDVIALVVQFD